MPLSIEANGFYYLRAKQNGLRKLKESKEGLGHLVGGIKRVGGREMQEGRDMGTYVYV